MAVKRAPKRKQLVKKKNGIVKYKFRPPTPQQVISIAKNPSKLSALMQERTVMKEVARGRSYEEVAEKLGVSTVEAFRIAREAINKCITETGFNAMESRQLDLNRYDALLVILWEQAEPKETIDGVTGSTIMIPPNLAAIKMIIEILDKRADILGYSAAKKLEVKEKVEHFHRLYIGANVDAL